MDYKSLPTVDSVNLEKYWDVVRQLDPEFYLLRISLKETGVNPMIIPKIIRSMANIALGTGYGKVTIYLSNKKVTKVDGTEADEVNQTVINEFGEKDTNY